MKSGSLAQLVEQLTFNQLVAGSNPARPTISLKFSLGAFKLLETLKYWNTYPVCLYTPKIFHSRIVD